MKSSSSFTQIVLQLAACRSLLSVLTLWHSIWNLSATLSVNTRSYSMVAMDVSVSFSKHVCTQCCACPWECNCQAMVYVTDMLGTCRFCPVASKLVRPTPALAGSVKGTVINTDITDNHSSQSWSPFCRMLRP